MAAMNCFQTVMRVPHASVTSTTFRTLLEVQEPYLKLLPPMHRRCKTDFGGRRCTGSIEKTPTVGLPVLSELETRLGRTNL